MNEGSAICLRLIGEVEEKYIPIADLKKNRHMATERFQNNHIDASSAYSRDKPLLSNSHNATNHESCSYRPKARITPVSASAYNSTHKLRFSDNMPNTNKHLNSR